MNYKKCLKNQPLHPLLIGRNDHSKESKHSMQSKNVFPSKIMVFLQLLTIATPAKTRYSAFTYTISYIYIQIMYQPHPGRVGSHVLAASLLPLSDSMAIQEHGKGEIPKTEFPYLFFVAGYGLSGGAIYCNFDIEVRLTHCQFFYYSRLYL